MSKRAILPGGSSSAQAYGAVLEALGPEHLAQMQAKRMGSGNAIKRQKPLAWQEGFAAGKKEGFDQGYAEGHAVGLDEERTRYLLEADHFARSLSTIIEQAQDAAPQFFEKLESDLASLAAVIAERVLHQELEMSRESVISITRAALKEALPNRDLRIKVNPEDSSLIDAHKKELFGSCANSVNIQILADPSIAAGCIIETEGGAVDARVEQMLAQVLEVCRRSE